LEVKYLSIFLFAVSIFVFYALSRQLSSSSVIALLATCIYVSDAWLLKWTGSTMESSLASFLVLSVAYLLLHSDNTRYLVITSLAMGLATLARPEILLLFLFFLILHFANGGNPSAKLKRVFVASIAYSVILIPWLLFTVVTFGSPIPNTFLAKTVASETTIGQVGWYFFRVIGLSYWWAWIIAFIGLILFLVNGTKNRAAPSIDFKNRSTALLWLWCAAIPIYYSVSKLQTPSTRYLQITTPILITVGFYGLTQLVNIFSQKWRKVENQRLLLTSTAIGIIVFNIALNALIVLPSSQDFSEGILQTYHDVGEWLKTNTPENSRVAIAIDVGTIGYYSHREIIDLGGLNTPDAIPYLPDSQRYVFIAKPDYLVVTGEQSQYGLLDQTRFKGIAAPILSLPMQAGIRADIDQTTGGKQNSSRYVTVYRLSW
jgi:hypothetical protein